MEEKKQCKYCKSEIDKSAKVCPNCKRSQGIKGWQIVLIIIAIIVVLVIIINGSTENKNQTKQTNSDTLIDSDMISAILEETKKEEIKRYKLNDEVYLSNSEEEYTIKITGIKEMKERNKFSDKNPAQVFLIDYTYKNIKGDDLFISESSFTIIDQYGEVGDTYPNSISNYPKRIPAGSTCKAQMILCVNNKSSKIELQYKDNMFQDKADMIFDIEI